MIIKKQHYGKNCYHHNIKMAALTDLGRVDHDLDAVL